MIEVNDSNSYLIEMRYAYDVPIGDLAEGSEAAMEQDARRSQRLRYEEVSMYGGAVMAKVEVGFNRTRRVVGHVVAGPDQL